MDEVERLTNLVDKLEQQLKAVWSTQQILQTFIVTSLKTANQNKNELRCSFCGKTSSNVAKLVAGPGVFICDECIDLCQEILDEESYSESVVPDVPKANNLNEANAIAHESAEAETANYLSDSSENLQCSFCGKERRQVRKLITGPNVNICNGCVSLVQEILDEELPQIDDDKSPADKNLARQSRKGSRCGFCGKSEIETSEFVAGPGVNICKECVTLCKEVLDDKARNSK